MIESVAGSAAQAVVPLSGWLGGYRSNPQHAQLSGRGGRKKSYLEIIDSQERNTTHTHKRDRV